MRAWFLVVLLAACEKSEPATAPSPEPPARDRDVELSTLAADMIAYTKQMPQILEGFDGNCAKHAERLLVLEPLASSIRARGSTLTPAENKSVRERIAARKAEVFQEIDAALAAKHLTRADIEAKDAAVNAACASDPQVKAAMERVGVFKKTP